MNFFTKSFSSCKELFLEKTTQKRRVSMNGHRYLRDPKYCQQWLFLPEYPGLLIVMGYSMRCFYSPEFYLDLPSDHPYPMQKFRISKDMLLERGTVRPEDIVEVRPAATHVLERAHTPAYLQKIYSGQLDRKEQIQLGFPLTPQLYTRSALEVEATRLACEAALQDGAAVVLAGGTHHAFREHGEGYCVFNDIAVAIRSLQVKRPGIKVMVVDTDAHQGNGTNSLLDNDPNVFTYSIHVGRNDPVRKVKGSMDVETVRYVEGEMYLKQLFSTLAAAMDVFSPDLVIWIAGADNHRNDQLGQMMLTVKDIQRRDEVILGAMLRNRIPIALLYGGGYNRQPEYTAKLHRNTVVTAKRILGEVQGLVS
ncbi:MAG: histone deacetylase [Roseibacillus sp.]|nr:histone deacetylase [Roseibacillus sp.]